MQVRYGSVTCYGTFRRNDYGTDLAGYASARPATGAMRRAVVDSALPTATCCNCTAADYPEALDELHGQKQRQWAAKPPLSGADGLFLASWAGRACCAELADLAGRSGAYLERELEERMRSRSVAAWVDALNKAGIGAHRVVASLTELMTDPLVQARGLAITRDHEGFGPITTTAPGVKLSRTPVTVGRPAARPGSDAASVLAEIGLGGELERLTREGVIAVDGVKAGC
jgi:hypothetical protein